MFDRMESFMNKSDLVTEVAGELECSRAAATRAIDAVLGGIEKGVSSGEGVTISGFGSFSRRFRAGRTVRNPSTGDPIKLGPSTSVGFRPGCRLRDAVR